MQVDHQAEMVRLTKKFGDQITELNKKLEVAQDRENAAKVTSFPLSTPFSSCSSPDYNPAGKKLPTARLRAARFCQTLGRVCACVCVHFHPPCVVWTILRVVLFVMLQTKLRECKAQMRKESELLSSAFYNLAIEQQRRLLNPSVHSSGSRPSSVVCVFP